MSVFMIYVYDNISERPNSSSNHKETVYQNSRANNQILFKILRHVETQPAKNSLNVYPTYLVPIIYIVLFYRTRRRPPYAQGRQIFIL